MTSIVFAEANANLKSLMVEKILENENLELLGESCEGMDAFKKILKYQPDVALFDILLPYYDGFTLLKKIKDEIPKKIKCVVTTPMTNEVIIREFYNRGIDYVVVKPYEPNVLVEKIQRIAQLDEAKNLSIVEKNQLDCQITKTLLDLGMSANLTGFKYMISAVKYVIEDESLLECVTKFLYPKIAKFYGATPSRVEKSMRHAIEIAWKKNVNSILKIHLDKTLKSGKNRPTNSEFIAGVSQSILLSI